MASPAQIRAEAYGMHVVKTAEDIVKEANSAAAKAERAAAEEAAKLAKAEAAKIKKWKGKPAPTPPVEPPAPITAKAKAQKAWLDKVEARYDALGTGKKLSQSYNYKYVRAAEHFDDDAIAFLKQNKYIDDALEAEIRSAKQLGNTLDAADEKAYKSALRGYKNRKTRHDRYLQEWREANGIEAGKLQGMDGAKVFTSNYEATSWATDKLYKFGARGDGPAKKALQAYTGSSYRSWNDALRRAKGKGDLGHWADDTRIVDEGMQKSLIPEDVIVHRGTNFDEVEFDGGLRSSSVPPPDPRTLIGTVQTQHGYMSTSVGTEAAFSGRLKLVVRVPAGHPAAYVDNFSRFKGERELLLSRDTQLFVHDVYEQGGRWVAEAEVLPLGTDPFSLQGHPTMPRSNRP
jgi:hypothetical protein